MQAQSFLATQQQGEQLQQQLRQQQLQQEQQLQQQQQQRLQQQQLQQQQTESTQFQQQSSDSSQQFHGQQAFEIVTRFSEAVEKNSQALIALESEQERLTQREADFEARMLAARKPTPSKDGEKEDGAKEDTAKEDTAKEDTAKVAVAVPCKDYSKPDPVTDTKSCVSACDADGLYGGDFKGSKGSGNCNCQVEKGNKEKSSEVCNDRGSGLTLSLVSVLSTILMMLHNL